MTEAEPASEAEPLEWIAQRQRLVADLKLSPDLTLTIEQRITGDNWDQGVRDQDVWHVEIDAGQVTFRSGPHPDPTLTLTASQRTTEAIRNRRQSAQRAFLNGELKVGGNIGALLNSHIQLERVAAILALPVRSPRR